MNRKPGNQPPVYPVEQIIIPEPICHRLDNGVPVYLIDAGTEEIMRLEFTFSAGQVNEYMPLLASTTNMMLMEGSENYSSEEVNILFDYYGVFLNLSFEKDRSGIILFFLNKHIGKVIELCSEILFRPVFPEDELRALMNKRLHWYNVNREKVQNLAADQFFESVFGKHHPYGRQLHKQDFVSMNTSLLKDFHLEYYTLDNMTIIISGKIHERTTEFLNVFFGYKGPKKITNEPKVNILKGENRKMVHIEKNGMIQSAIRIGSSTINKLHPDYPGLKILNTLLGGYFGSRLMKNIREDKGFTYGIDSSVSSLEMAGYKMISTEVSQKNLQQTIDEIYKEIRRIQSFPPGKNEMSVVRNYMLGEMVRMFDGPFALAESFRSVWDYRLDNSYYYRFVQKIKSIDPDEITELAKTYYKTDELYQITAGTK